MHWWTDNLTLRVGERRKDSYHCRKTLNMGDYLLKKFTELPCETGTFSGYAIDGSSIKSMLEAETGTHHETSRNLVWLQLQGYVNGGEVSWTWQWREMAITNDWRYFLVCQEIRFNSCVNAAHSCDDSQPSSFRRTMLIKVDYTNKMDAYTVLLF